MSAQDYADAAQPRNCAHCGGPRLLRNPTGACDHLYWPDNLSAAAREANGLESRKDDRPHEVVNGVRVEPMSDRLPKW